MESHEKAISSPKELVEIELPLIKEYGDGYLIRMMWSTVCGVLFVENKGVISGGEKRAPPFLCHTVCPMIQLISFFPAC